MPLRIKRRVLFASAASPLLSACAERFFFYPDRQTYVSRNQLNTKVTDVFVSEGGASLHGWWMPAAGQARALIVHLHGNAANVSNHAGQVAWLPVHGFSVLTFDYQGFGYSEGSPSLDGIVADAGRAIARARELEPKAPLVLLGQSLGGATAIRVAAIEKEPIRLLILDSAFASYRDIVRDATSKTVLFLVSPLAEASLPQRRHDPIRAIAALRMPLLFLHGEKDRVVPMHHSERLYAAALETRSKQLLRIPRGEHLDALRREGIRAHIIRTIESAIG